MQATTLKRYAADHHAFTKWATAENLSTLPASAAAVARYIAFLGERQTPFASIERALYGITAIEVDRGFQEISKAPEVRSALIALQSRGDVRLERATYPGLLRADIENIVETIRVDGTRAAARDAALVTLAHHAGLKNYHLSALDVEHVRYTNQGVDLYLKRPRGNMQWAHIAAEPNGTLDPVSAIVKWFAVRGNYDGALFLRIDRHDNVRPARLSTDAIGHIVVRRAEKSGLNVRGAQSFRNGAVAELAARDFSEEEIGARLGYTETVHLAPIISAARATRRVITGRIHEIKTA